jgi:uncharacterized phage protein (TIGR01671 family)
MRTIRFRGKRLNGDGWIYGDIIQYPDDGSVEIVENYNEMAWVDPATVGQFTGQFDKNGKDIYEGDIIRRFSNINRISDPNLTDREPEYMTAFIEYIQGIYRVSSKEFPVGGCGAFNYSESNAAYNIEVIGNIHDNSELLNSESNEKQNSNEAT